MQGVALRGRVELVDLSERELEAGISERTRKGQFLKIEKEERLIVEGRKFDVEFVNVKANHILNTLAHFRHCDIFLILCQDKDSVHAGGGILPRISRFADIECPGYGIYPTEYISG